MENLNVKAFGGLFFTLFGISVLLFVPAGTVHYWQAWIFLTVFGLLGLGITLYLMNTDPGLLQRRTVAGPTAEKEPVQRIIMALASLGFVSILVVSALDHRFGWATVPSYVSIAGDALIVFGYIIIFFVFKQNSFASATIEHSSEQKVVTTGLYALVRHPMYMGGFIYLFGTPLALGSLWGLLVLALMMPALIWRLLEEEKFLVKNLPGYAEYQKKVRRRLVPFIW